jgi:hypothetical protein
VGGGEVQPPEYDFRDSARKVVRGLDGMLIAEPLVWTARVAKLRADAEAGIKRAAVAASFIYILALIMSIFLLLSIANYEFLLRIANSVWPPSGWDYSRYEVGYVLLVIIGISWWICIASHRAVKARAARVYRETWEWLLSTELGVMIVDPTYQGAVFQHLEPTIIRKWITPPPPRNFEEHLEWAAINAELLVQMSRKGVGVAAGMSRADTWPETSRFAVSYAFCLAGFLSISMLWLFQTSNTPPIWLIALLNIFAGVVMVAQKKHARLIAICDYLLEDASIDYCHTRNQPPSYPRCL